MRLLVCSPLDRHWLRPLRHSASYSSTCPLDPPILLLLAIFGTWNYFRNLEGKHTCYSSRLETSLKPDFLFSIQSFSPLICWGDSFCWFISYHSFNFGICFRKNSAMNQRRICRTVQNLLQQDFPQFRLHRIM